MKTQSLSCYGAEMTPERWQQLDVFQSRLEGKPDKRALLGNAFDRKAAALQRPSNLVLGRVGYLTWHDCLLSHCWRRRIWRIERLRVISPETLS